MLSRKRIAVPFDNETHQVAVQRREGSSEWLLAIHGLQSNQHMFDDLLSAPWAKERSILTLDLLGFGASDKPESFSYDLLDHAKVVAKVIESEGIPKLTVIGHSLGGMIGTLLLDLIPQKISSLVSLEGNLVLEDCGESLRVSEMAFERFNRFYDRLKERIRVSEGVSGEKRAEWMQEIPPHAFYATAGSIVKWAKSNRLIEIFRSSAQRKLLIVGSKSQYQSRPADDRTTVHTIEGAGHFMLLGKPEETLEAIRRFLGP